MNFILCTSGRLIDKQTCILDKKLPALIVHWIQFKVCIVNLFQVGYTEIFQMDRTEQRVNFTTRATIAQPLCNLWRIIALFCILSSVWLSFYPEPSSTVYRETAPQVSWRGIISGSNRQHFNGHAQLYQNHKVCEKNTCNLENKMITSLILIHFCYCAYLRWWISFIDALLPMWVKIYSMAIWDAYNM